jgi:predicted O-linked N-acetylglucosamine transferase (SPINDLY family)
MIINCSQTSSAFGQQAYQCFIQGNYYQAASLYEEAIKAEPDIKLHYWYLGLILLLQEQEVEAQTTWLMAVIECEPQELDLCNQELIQVLKTEAERYVKLADYSNAYLLRKHIKEIQPTDINNFLHLIQLSIQLESFSGEDLYSLGLIQILQLESIQEFSVDFLMQVLQQVLDCAPLHSASLEFAKACLPYLKNIYKFFAVLLVTAINTAYSLRDPQQGAQYAELCQQIDGEDLELLRHLSSIYQNAGNYGKGIEIAKKCYSLLEDVELADKIFANHLVLRGLMYASGYQDEAQEILKRQELLLSELIKQQPILDDCAQISRLLVSTFFFPYFRDNLEQNRTLQNQIAAIFQRNLQNHVCERSESYKNRQQPPYPKLNQSSKCLKIGYLSHCFRQHSVGWLARWLFEHHDREKFELYGYFVSYKQKEDPLQQWYNHQFQTIHKLGINSQEIAEKIEQDEIDILIDLDSLTLDVSCEVMALKPAPIQISWLGWDASGIPAVDYFIADPYVLPDYAQNFYSEKIWRLPQTYIAVDGFEVGVPTIRRNHLNIPNDAIVYLSSQGSSKRHPDTVRLQMKILKAVPNSYFLIKGLGDRESIKDFFTEIAATEGVDSDRLRFLSEVPSESIHRANLTIADIVLDTYPYNGATTTLETLWMGIPLVTRVGEQFASRNSYTMMVNAGVTEGIAWTSEEYVEWGIRMGKNSGLRQKVSSKLRQSRRSAPLWNAQQFTREMEKAYEKMWQIYVESKI